MQEVLGWVWGSRLGATGKLSPKVVKEPSILGQVHPQPHRLQPVAVGSLRAFL